MKIAHRPRLPGVAVVAQILLVCIAVTRMIHGPDSHGNQDADYRGSRNESTNCKYVEYHFRPPSIFRLIIHSGDSGFRCQ